MGKYRNITIGAGAAVLIIAAVFFVSARTGPKTTTSEKSATTTTQTRTTWQTLRNDEYGVSIEYPSDMTADEHFVTPGPSGLLSGIGFRLPERFYAGTNLSADSHIDILRVPLANGVCSPVSFTSEPAETIEQATIDGIDWTTMKTASAGAGSIFDQSVYATGNGGYCYAVRLFLHSTNVDNYPRGTIEKYDSGSIESLFDQMLETFTFTSK